MPLLTELGIFRDSIAINIPPRWGCTIPRAVPLLPAPQRKQARILEPRAQHDRAISLRHLAHPLYRNIQPIALKRFRSRQDFAVLFYQFNDDLTEVALGIEMQPGPVEPDR